MQTKIAVLPVPVCLWEVIAVAKLYHNTLLVQFIFCYIRSWFIFLIKFLPNCSITSVIYIKCWHIHVWWKFWYLGRVYYENIIWLERTFFRHGIAKRVFGKRKEIMFKFLKCFMIIHGHWKSIMIEHQTMKKLINFLIHERAAVVHLNWSPAYQFICSMGNSFSQETFRFVDEINIYI